MNQGGQSNSSYPSVGGQHALFNHGYPRPVLQRAEWISLNGEWQFAIDPEGRWTRPADVGWYRTILVPYAPETSASGIGNTGLYQACWYRRIIDVATLPPDERWILHFGAVDYDATVWLNGHVAARHQGGYTPFQVDITPYVGAGTLEIVVRAHDDPHDLAKPRGKQDWCLEPHSIWYPRTTGIWQSVWLERLPATAIGGIRWTPSLERWEMGFTAWLDGSPRDDLRLRVHLAGGGKTLADDSYRVVAGQVHRGIVLHDAGVDDGRQALLWSPEYPNLIHAEVSLVSEDGQTIDTVTSYCALRSVSVDENRILLNGCPYPLRFVLDQGYWPDSGLTAPGDEALRQDVLLAKAMGFNGVRKHQKIEDPRYLYWADQLGLLVWEEMPTAHQFTQIAIQRFMGEWTEAIARDFNHPCVIAWVPFNESWGTPNLAGVGEQRHYARSVYHLTKALDPTRPVVGNDGWESIETDIVGIHDYCQDPARLTHRYQTAEVLSQILSERPSGRIVSLNGKDLGAKPVMLTEFGGMALSGDPATWGYSRCVSAEEFSRAFAGLVDAVKHADALAGYCYTQFADTYQETNGLLQADRTPKLPLDEIRDATMGVNGKRQPMLPAAKRRALRRAR